MRKLLIAAFLTVMSSAAYAGCAPEVELGIDRAIESDDRSTDTELEFGITLKWELGHGSKCDQERLEAEKLLAEIEKEKADALKKRTDAEKVSIINKQETLEYLEDMLKLCQKGLELNSPAIISQCKEEGIIE